MESCQVFEYQCAGCYMYNVPFTGLTLIPLVKTYNYYTYITEYYPMWKKFVNLNSQRVSLVLYFVMKGFYSPKVVNPRFYSFSIIKDSVISFTHKWISHFKYDTCSQDLELIQTLYYINLVDVFSNIEHRILKKSKLVHSKICIKIQYIGHLLSFKNG
jgi:hypothetical protein